jgi:hypothetical protein
MDLPALPYREWRETLETLHRWTQIVGKIQMELTPTVNHWWNVSLHVTAHGLATNAIIVGNRWFELELDFVEDVLRVRTSDAATRGLPLRPRSVANMYEEVMKTLSGVGIRCPIWSTPVEIANPIPFELDHDHRAYDKKYVMRFWQTVSQVTGVLDKVRAEFVGKSSPVQFFWGSFDLALARFSGRRAPAFEGNSIEREAYSHENITIGWWPGDARFEHPAFYTIAAPEPSGFSAARIAEPAFYSAPLRGWYLEHEKVRNADDPEAMLLDFYRTTYNAAADLAAWPRADLERPPWQEEQQHGHV